MKHFLNERERLVQDSIEGLVATSGGRLCRLDGYPHIKVVLRSQWDKTKVALISGGGSGHEPAHGGFVGAGMLTAAVCGEVFASPSVESVLAAIRAVTGRSGALLIVKNYTGDRLNFGLAAERARQMGFKVSLVVVGDDISLAPSIHPRGIAGTLFVHKVAGYYAEQGADLESVARVASEAALATRSLGLALTTCHTPGSAEKETVASGQAELGLGIHGEPGAQRVEMTSAQGLVTLIVRELADKTGEGLLCALINNLGSVPPLEMSLLAREYLNSPLGSRTELVVGPAHLMTSYDMNGFSISLLSLSEEFRQALLAPVEAPAWPGAHRVTTPQLVPLPETRTATPAPSSDPLVQAKLQAILSVLQENRAALNALDGKIGDGDAGDTLAAAAAAIEASLERLPFGQPSELLAELSYLLGHAGGSSGILLAIFTGAASASYRDSPTWASALSYGMERVSFYGGAQPGDRTMLDALHPALAVLQSGGSLAEAARAAREGAQATGSMARAGAGRSAYLNAENLRGVVDPGAEAVALAFEALATRS